MERQFSEVFWMNYDAAARKPRYISNRGGTRSGKTYSVLQFLNELIPQADKAGDITSVCSESLPHLKRGAIRDFEKIIGHSLKDDAHWNATDCIFEYPNGAKLEFFSVDTPARVHGPARKRLFLNECNHIPYETFRQLAVRTTGIIFLDYNPCEVFWAIEQVETRPNCITIHSTYKNNEFLSKEQVDEIEANRNDENWWKVYGEGKIGQLEGVIYKFDTIDELPSGDEASSLKECYGLDFGFTNDPTAGVRVLADTGRKVLYVDEICYKTRMTNPEIAALLKEQGISPYVEVFADCAEPKSIAEIGREGLNIVACDKDAPVKSDKLKFQIQWMQGWTIKVTKRSLNLIKELRNYTWSKDKDGNPLNVPIDKFNHLLDALRYAVWSKFAQRQGYGEYHISIR